LTNTSAWYPGHREEVHVGIVNLETVVKILGHVDPLRAWCNA
jgi:hypothetical protein